MNELHGGKQHVMDYLLVECYEKKINAAIVVENVAVTACLVHSCFSVELAENLVVDYSPC